MSKTAYDPIKCQVVNLSDIYTKHIGYKTDGRFVEVGAFNCINWSNTYALAKIGWRGIMIEPQHQYFDDCVKLYADNPSIILENCCAGIDEDMIKLYLGGSLTTTRFEMVGIYNSIPWSQSSGLREDNFIYVPVFTLDYLLKKHKWEPCFDVLVVDVEGAEMDVLSGFDLKHWQPTLAIIETHAKYPDGRLSRKAIPVNEYFSDEYEIIYEDNVNSIYARV